jgi:polar amino acid transport system substrate-binding protein
MSHTKKRDEQVDFSQTYFWSRQTFLVKKDGPGSLADLVGKKVGMSRGSHAIGNWKSWQERHGHTPDPSLVLEFGDKQAAVDAVLSGAIAGYAEDFEVLSGFARRDPSLTVLGGEGIGLKQDGIGVREGESKLRDAVNFALQSLWRSGEYQKIYEHWFGPQATVPVPLEHEIEVWPDG